MAILDARDYAGGRVRTIRDFSAGQHAELGGEFIEPDHKEILGLCRAFGLRPIRVVRSGFTHRFRDASGTYHLSRTAPWQSLAECTGPLLRRYRFAGSSSSADDVREMATMSLSEWLRRSKESQELHAMATALRGFFLADPDEISVLPVVERIAKGGSPAQVEFFRIEGGNDRLVDALVGATPGRLLLGFYDSACRACRRSRFCQCHRRLGSDPGNRMRLPGHDASRVDAAGSGDPSCAT